jgi:SAM-dependent methyltransferase
MGFASGYQRFMGRWSERLAGPVVDFCRIGDGETVLDVGCGLGSLSRTVIDRTDRTVVIGIDRRHDAVMTARSWAASHRAAFHVGDARQMPYGDNTFDRYISLLMLNFLPDYQKAAAEMVRVTRVGGMIGAATWDFAGGLPAHRMFYDTIAALDPNAGFRKGFLRPLQRKGELVQLWREAGLTAVEEIAVTIWMKFKDFADYWSAYAWATDDYLRSLPQGRSRRLEERIRAAYITGGEDGPRAFTATAWVVRGVRSSPG